MTATLRKTERDALAWARTGPLFRVRRHWRRPGGATVSAAVVARLLSVDLLRHSVTRRGIPCVVITGAGRAAIAVSKYDHSAVDRAAAVAAAAALHERIAP